MNAGGVPENYGLGWSAGPTFGHGGAFSTNMSVDPQKQLVFVYIGAASAGYGGTDGGKVHPAFVKAAMEAFAK